jgi:hypothetical protein
MEELKNKDSYLFTKKKKFFTVIYKGITFTDEESLLNFQRKERLDNILDNKELKVIMNFILNYQRI